MSHDDEKPISDPTALDGYSLDGRFPVWATIGLICGVVLRLLLWPFRRR